MYISAPLLFILICLNVCIHAEICCVWFIFWHTLSNKHSRGIVASAVIFICQNANCTQGIAVCKLYLMLDILLVKRETHEATMHPNAPYFIILLCLMPDNFTQ
jgi:hypothetical protein